MLEKEERKISPHSDDRFLVSWIFQRKNILISLASAIIYNSLADDPSSVLQLSVDNQFLQNNNTNSDKGTEQAMKGPRRG
jgi:hypothetical protein